MTGRSLVFADGILRRYRGVEALRRPAGLVLRQPSRRSGPTVVMQPAGATFVHAPRVSFGWSVVRRLERLAERTERTLRVERIVRTNTIERLHARMVRIERLPGPPVQATGPGRAPAVVAAGRSAAFDPPPDPPGLPERAVPLVVRKTIVERVPAVPPTTPAEPARTGATDGAPATLAPNAVRAAVDVHRLADEVLGVIDRRIVAQRERYGRV